MEWFDKMDTGLKPMGLKMNLDMPWKQWMTREWSETWIKWWPWKPMDEIWLESNKTMRTFSQWIEFEWNMNASLPYTNHISPWTRVLTRSKIKVSSNKQVPQTKWAVNISSAPMSWTTNRVSTTSKKTTRYTSFSDQELGFGMEWTPRCDFHCLKHLTTRGLHLDRHDGLFTLTATSQLLGFDPQANLSSL